MADTDDTDDLWTGADLLDDADMEDFLDPNNPDHEPSIHAARQHAMIPTDPNGADLFDDQVGDETLLSVWNDADEGERQTVLASEEFQTWLSDNGYVKEESLEESAPAVEPIPNSLAEWARDQYGNQWADFAKRHGLPETAPRVSVAALRLATRAVELYESGKNYP